MAFTETYVKGSYCPPIKGSRTVDIEYRCSRTNKFLSVNLRIIIQFNSGLNRLMT